MNERNFHLRSGRHIFHICILRRRRTGSSQPDLARIWPDLCHRFHDRNRLCHQICHKQGKRRKHRPLFRTVSNLVYSGRHPIHADRNLHPGQSTGTAVCPTVTMAICTTHYRSHKNHVGFRWKKPSFSHLISCCQLGVSAFVGEMSSGVTAIVFNFLILGIAGNVGVLWSRSKPRHRSSSHLQRSRSRRPATDE